MRDRARLHLLDWLGCVAGALQSPVAAAVCSVRGATVVERAAFLGNVLEMDDIHRGSILHPGPVVWPVVLTGGRAAMDEILVAAVRGYEATIAIGATFDATHYAHHHNTATAGVFGAAAAAASLVGCDHDQTTAALGLAGSVSGGLWQMRNEAVMAKQWHCSHAVETGRRAAQCAFAGVTGPRYILEGPQGIYAATCHAPKQMLLGEGWQIEAVSFKPWGACRHAHPAIDAAIALGETLARDGPIIVETYRDALTFCDRPDPSTVHEAKFSLQHAVAVVAERGAPTLADFEPEAISALTAARARVIVREGADFTARFPDHYGAAVSAGGQAIERIDTLGDPERPLSREGVIAKARDLLEWGGVARDADAAVAACLHGDDPGAVLALLERWL